MCFEHSSGTEALDYHPVLQRRLQCGEALTGVHVASAAPDVSVRK